MSWSLGTSSRCLCLGKTILCKSIFVIRIRDLPQFFSRSQTEVTGVPDCGEVEEDSCWIGALVFSMIVSVER
jgi:hypothetical protein